MKTKLSLFFLSLFVSCTNNEMNILNDYWNCDQMLNTTGLKLYQFTPFTDKEWREMSYDYKLERRQIPEGFLTAMTTKELFYQFVNTDLSKSIVVANTIQQGFEREANRMNMLSELLNRPDAGLTLLELLQKTDPSTINGPDCFWWFECLQIIAAQPDVINNMIDKDIDNYVLQQMRCHDAILRLSKSEDIWDYPQSVGIILFGIGNVMLKYEYEPFIQLIKENEYCRNLMMSAMLIDEQTTILIINCIHNFQKNYDELKKM